jgi:DNA replication licensing factor MCM6
VKIVISWFLSFFEICFRYKIDPNAPDPYYEAEVERMRSTESNTMFIDFSHVMEFNDVLQRAISEEYLRCFFFFQ